MGAGPGMGQSLVKIFARAGHPVAIVSRTLSKLQTQADEINALVKQSDRVKPFAADATDEAAVEKAFSDIQNAFKPARIHTDGPRSSAFAAGKAGLRSLSQSLARQYQPQNIHVAHFVIDGGINTPLAIAFMESTLRPTLGWIQSK